MLSSTIHKAIRFSLLPKIKESSSRQLQLPSLPRLEFYFAQLSNRFPKEPWHASTVLIISGKGLLIFSSFRVFFAPVTRDARCMLLLVLGTKNRVSTPGRFYPFPLP